MLDIGDIMLKLIDLKVDDTVKDSWYWQDWGFGKVTKKLKTVVHIKYPSKNKMIYDKQHIEMFLIKMS